MSIGYFRDEKTTFDGTHGIKDPPARISDNSALEYLAAEIRRSRVLSGSHYRMDEGGVVVVDGFLLREPDYTPVVRYRPLLKGAEIEYCRPLWDFAEHSTLLRVETE